MFSGFYPETQEFLLGLAFNNDRGWFTEHKQEYEEYLKKPFAAFSDAVLLGMEERYPEKQWKMKVSRIYRDARRLFGRGPYKDHLWFGLREQDMLGPGRPSFWFSTEPDCCCFGMGIYTETAEEKERYRRYIDANPGAMERLALEFEKQDDFVLSGRSYARPKGSYPEPLSKWYNLMEFSLERQMDYGPEVYTKKLVDTVLEGFSCLMPYYEHFCLMIRNEPDNTK